MPPFNPFSVITSKIYGALAIGAIVVAGAQTVRIEGALCRDVAAGEYSRCLLTGFKQDVADRDLTVQKRTVERDQERWQHQQTKLDYRAAQATAAELDRRRIERVQAEQQEITDEVTADYRARLAVARARAEQLRSEAARAREHPVGAAGGKQLPGAGDPAGRADAPADDPGLPPGADDLTWRLTATEQALQLDALIDWVEQQSGVRFVDGPKERRDEPIAPLLEAGR